MPVKDDTWIVPRYRETHRENDTRTKYERDYARLIHSAAFRRLQNKTQILGLGESDFYRTRLTHSLEVMQIGAGLVKTLRQRHKHDAVAYLPDTELIQSICLAHDIGHPPFGHGGEVALNYSMRDHGGFEGNGQTLRILARLEKYTERHGLNPSRRLLLGVIKYPAPYSALVNKEAYGPRKPGDIHFKAAEQKPPKCYLDTEQDVVDWILEPVSATDRALFTKPFPPDKPGKHAKTRCKAFDTSIMDLADDISYGVHDLEDGIALNMVTRDVWQQARSCVPDKYKAKFIELEEELFSGHSYRRKHAIGTLVNLFMTTAVIRELNFEEPLLRFNTGHEDEEKGFLQLLKDIVDTHVIRNTNVQLLEYKGQVVITTLFTTIFSDPERFLHKEYNNQYAEAATPMEKARVVCDYIAGMSDPYAAKLYLKITQPGSGSIFEQL